MERLVLTAIAGVIWLLGALVTMVLVPLLGAVFTAALLVTPELHSTLQCALYVLATLAITCPRQVPQPVVIDLVDNDDELLHFLLLNPRWEVCA